MASSDAGLTASDRNVAITNRIAFCHHESNCLLVMKIKWSLDINTGAVERSEAARARRLAGATVVGDDVITS